MNKTIKTIQTAIKNTKFEGQVFIAGGHCRDQIMKRSSKDVDIVVALPNGGIELANFLHKSLKLAHAPVVFERFGTAQLIIDGEEVEFVMSRKESYNGIDRNPDVILGSINDDVARRDFTINSLLFDVSNGNIIDLVNGSKDIENRLIKTTSDPMVIFKDDPLRIMRAIRFATVLDFHIEEATMNAIKLFVPSLSKISKERIRDEFIKILSSDNVRFGVELLMDTGILSWMVPEFANVDSVKNQGKWHTKDLRNHILDVISNIKSTWRHRLAALLHDIGKPKTMTIDETGVHFYAHQHVSANITRGFMKNFKFTNSDIELVSTAVSLHMGFVEEMTPKTLRKKINEHGKDMFVFCCDLAEADSKRAERRKIVADIREFIETDKPEEKVVLPLNGNEIMELFNLKPSRRVGELLNVVKEAVFENPNLTKEEAIELLRNV